MSISFDLPNRPLSFFAFHYLYREWAYMIACWSILLSVVTAFLHLTACIELAFSAILSLTFIGLMTVYYEESLHALGSYTKFRRGGLVLLGLLSIVVFSAGLMVGVMQLLERGLPQ